MATDYFKSLIAEQPRMRFLAAVMVGAPLAFVSGGGLWTIITGHYAWSDLKRNPQSAGFRKPWLIGVLVLGYGVGLPMSFVAPDSRLYWHLLWNSLGSSFLVFQDDHPVLLKCIIGAVLLLFSPILLLLARAFVCRCIGTWGLDEKLDESRSAMKKEMEILRAENKAVLAKLDEIKSELIAARANASPEGGTNRLIVP